MVKRKFRSVLQWILLLLRRWIRDRDVFVATARELGSGSECSGCGSRYKRADQPDRLLYQETYGCDCDHRKGLRCAYRRLWSVHTAAGIRVISYDRMVNDANTDMYISFDNRMVGEIMAQSMDGSHSGRRKDLYDPGIRHR